MTAGPDPRGGAGGAPAGGDPDARAAEFAALRPRLERIAYATLGSIAEAEDVVQDAWLRLQRTAPGEVRDLPAWLTTVVGRLALDALGSARVRRERYVGEWLPEPLVGEAADPADRVTLDEQVSLALLRVLESLSPPERTAFVLHDVFGHTFAEVGEAVGRTPEAARQLASRARRHVEAGRPRFPATPDQQREAVLAFGAAVADGDLDRLVALLDPDVTMRADGGGVAAAPRKPIHGGPRVAKALVGLARKGAADGAAARLVEVNGRPGLLFEGPAGIAVAAFAVDDGRITSIDIVRNPEKLAHVPRVESPVAFDLPPPDRGGT
jgi:RNA polymerase sigma-70 factor (ECF subfamily)